MDSRKLERLEKGEYRYRGWLIRETTSSYERRTYGAWLFRRPMEGTRDNRFAKTLRAAQAEIDIIERGGS